MEEILEELLYKISFYKNKGKKEMEEKEDPFFISIYHILAPFCIQKRAGFTAVSRHVPTQLPNTCFATDLTFNLISLTALYNGCDGLIPFE